MKYVLDTNAVSALMKGDSRVVERLRRVRKEDAVVAQPALAEIAYGIRRLPRSKRRASLEDRFELVCTELARLPWTDAVSERFGMIKAGLEQRGSRLEDFDIAIAAHAHAEDGVLVTANQKHMVRIEGLQIEDWTREPSR